MKYKLTDNKKQVGSRTLYQIQALKNFGKVQKDDLGGWIETKDNLSQEGNCWVFGNARVYGDAWVYDNLKLTKGYFFGYKKTDEELSFIPFNDGYQLVAKGDVKFTN